MVLLYRLACLPPKDCLHIKALVIDQAGLFIKQGGHGYEESQLILCCVRDREKEGIVDRFFLFIKILFVLIGLITFDLIIWLSIS